jgi:hypothetical protein
LTARLCSSTARVAEVVVERDAGVVDQDVERLDGLDRRLDLALIGHIEGDARDARIRVGQGLPAAGVDPLRAASQRLLDQCLPDAAIAPGHQKCLAFDRHDSSAVVVRGRIRRGCQ